MFIHLTQEFSLSKLVTSMRNDIAFPLLKLFNKKTTYTQRLVNYQVRDEPYNLKYIRCNFSCGLWV